MAQLRTNVPKTASYVLFMFVVVYTLNVADRSVIAVVQESLRKEFGWRDWELGLLGGTAFGLFYSVLGIPIARLAERHNRINIMAGSIALWSLMTACSGGVGILPLMLLARMGVGIGEAGGTPPAHSLISSYFPADRRASALSVYSIGMTLGPMVAALGGGWVLVNYGWRAVFFSLGVPGMLLAVIVKLTIRDPGHPVGSHADIPNFKAAIAGLWAKPTFRHVVIGAALANFVNAGMAQFTTSFFIRYHHLAVQQATLIFGITEGVFATAGVLLGGVLADRLQGRFPRILAWMSAIGLSLCIPIYILAYTASPLWLAVPALMSAKLCQWLYVSPLYAIVQGVAHPRARATATALNLFIANLVGFVFGPPAIGALSDLMFAIHLRTHGIAASQCLGVRQTLDSGCQTASAEGLQSAVLIFICIFAWPAVHFMRMGRSLREDMTS